MKCKLKHLQRHHSTNSQPSNPITVLHTCSLYVYDANNMMPITKAFWWRFSVSFSKKVRFCYSNLCIYQCSSKFSSLDRPFTSDSSVTPSLISHLSTIYTSYCILKRFFSFTSNLHSSIERSSWNILNFHKQPAWL